MYNFLCEKLQKKDSHNSKYFFMKILYKGIRKSGIDVVGYKNVQ